MSAYCEEHTTFTRVPQSVLPRFLSVPRPHLSLLLTWLIRNSHSSLVTCLQNHDHLHLLYQFVKVSLTVVLLLLQTDFGMPTGREVSRPPFHLSHHPLSPSFSEAAHSPDVSPVLKALGPTGRPCGRHPDTSLETQPGHAAFSIGPATPSE